MEEEKMTTYFEKLIKEASQKDMEDIFFVPRKKEEVVYEVTFKSREDERISVAELSYVEGMEALEEILEKAGLIFQKKTSQLGDFVYFDEENSKEITCRVSVLRDIFGMFSAAVRLLSVVSTTERKQSKPYEKLSDYDISKKDLDIFMTRLRSNPFCCFLGKNIQKRDKFAELVTSKAFDSVQTSTVFSIEEVEGNRKHNMMQFKIDPLAGFTYDSLLNLLKRHPKSVIYLENVESSERAQAAVDAYNMGFNVITTSDDTGKFFEEMRKHSRYKDNNDSSLMICFIDVDEL
jgi:hypothetical protein